MAFKEFLIQFNTHQNEKIFPSKHLLPNQNQSVLYWQNYFGLSITKHDLFKKTLNTGPERLGNVMNCHCRRNTLMDAGSKKGMGIQRNTKH